tara:strand:+ start:346 stop:852 length:507 start_codon:yes stop_codon:yes gene_type:complete
MKVNKQMQKRIVSIVIIVSTLLMTGCATIFTGTSDDIYINSNPSGAEIMIGGLKVGKTPATLTIKRPGFNDKEVVLKLDGYERRTFILKKSFNSVAILNLAGILGWAIDFATGSIYKYEPKSYEIDLETLAFNIDDLPHDKFGRIEIPNGNQPIMVVDSETGVQLLFK